MTEVPTVPVAVTWATTTEVVAEQVGQGVTTVVRVVLETLQVVQGTTVVVVEVQVGQGLVVVVVETVLLVLLLVVLEQEVVVEVVVEVLLAMIAMRSTFWQAEISTTPPPLVGLPLMP